MNYRNRRRRHDITLSQSQRDAVNSILTDRQNVFVTGYAGSGKSLIIKAVRGRIESRRLRINCRILAATNSAARRVGGKTIHSTFRIPFGAEFDNRFEAKVTRAIKRDLKSVNLFIIDEISLVSAEMLELMDRLLQNIQGNEHSFGGVQVVTVGDFAQLPPKRGHYAFQSNRWDRYFRKNFYFKDVYRQDNLEMVNALNEARLKPQGDGYSREAQQFFEGRVKAEPTKDLERTVIFGRIADARRWNDQITDSQLPGDAKLYHSVEKFDDVNILAEMECTAPTSVKLKVGSKVMLLVNVRRYNLVHGDCGIVVGLNGQGGCPIVAFPTVNGRTENFEVLHEQFALIFEGEKVGDRTAIALMPAYGLTCHKAQGLQFAKVTVDFTRFWLPGQGYTSISRAQDLSQFEICNLDLSKIYADPAVIDFHAKLEEIIAQE
ncbi:hypothetical protein MP228_004986 [Amoeboaphelidium protococcarum]|nr:hypothetical protein MP228_006822 [Amoeboaphelidium protococcarum]KAI3649517.1 hypothetical protein MP228_005149 [Amoeboaphelidium protococcarum]KAI3650159.1 hypothetical protein MP228_004986 [Amoeboaphelidium protococcarum]